MESKTKLLDQMRLVLRLKHLSIRTENTYVYWVKRFILFHQRLLLDSRVVDLPMAYNPTFVVLSSLKPFFFNSLKNEFRFSDNAGA
jgi:Phage integrase, N-terminal SAM-like domain